MIDWKCIASRIYNKINEKNTIYHNIMNNINSKLSKVKYCNKNQKFRTYIDYSFFHSFLLGLCGTNPTLCGTTFIGNSENRNEISFV